MTIQSPPITATTTHAPLAAMPSDQPNPAAPLSLEETNKLNRRLTQRVFTLETRLQNLEYLFQKLVQDTEIARQQRPSRYTARFVSRPTQTVIRQRYHPYNPSVQLRVVPKPNILFERFIHSLNTPNTRYGLEREKTKKEALSIIKNHSQYFNLLQARCSNPKESPTLKYLLGQCYASGISTPQNPELAFEWIRTAAEQGLADAQNDLAVFFGRGFGTDKKPKIAFKWFKKAAEQGHAPTQTNLGWCYHSGFGTDKNPKFAFEWYLKAAEQGYAQAQANLGWCYHNGFGTDKNPKLAFEWLQKAAVQGDQNAKKLLAIIKNSTN